MCQKWSGLVQFHHHLSQLHCWSLWMDKCFHPPLYDWTNYLSMLVKGAPEVCITDPLCNEAAWLTGSAHRAPLTWRVHFVNAPSNERRGYTVTSSFIGWVHSQNNPWTWQYLLGFPHHERCHFDMYIDVLFWGNDGWWGVCWHMEWWMMEWWMAFHATSH